MNKPIGAFFLEEGVLSEEQIAKAWEYAKKQKKKFEDAVLELKFLDEGTLASKLGTFYDVPFLDIDNYLVDPAIATIIPEHFSRRHLALAINKVGNRLTVALVDPTNVIAIDDITLMTGFLVKPVIATRSGIIKTLEALFRQPL